MSRQNQSQVTVTLELTPGKMTKIPDPFDKRTGGDVDSSETKYKPGGMAPERALGGTISVGNVTASRLLDRDRDWDLARKAGARCGKARMTVTEQPLDVNGFATDDPPLIWTGILKTVNYPDYDASSDSAAMFDLVMSTEGTVG